MRKYLGIMKNVQKFCSKQKLQKEPIFVVGGGVKDYSKASRCQKHHNVVIGIRMENSLEVIN